jgi:hypothetical protein
MIINATGMKWWNNSFHIDEHKINNTGWMMKWWWNRGVEWKANPIDVERMLNVFDLHFPTPAEKAVSRICAFKTERNLQMQIFGWCLQFKQSCPGYTILLLSAKQSRENQCNGVSRFKKNVSEKLSIIYPLWNEEKSLADWIHYICWQKTTASLWNLDRKGNWRKRNCVATG